MRHLNPRVSIRLDEVTAFDAAEALTYASGIDVRLTIPKLPTPPTPEQARALDEMGLVRLESFEWIELPFADALRELCRAFSLQPRPGRMGYVLQPRPEDPHCWDTGPIESERCFRNEDVVVYPLALSRSGGSRRDFVRTARHPDPQVLALYVGVRVAGGEANRVAYARDWRGVDDRGIPLVLSSAPLPPHGAARRRPT